VSGPSISSTEDVTIILVRYWSLACKSFNEFELTVLRQGRRALSRKHGQIGHRWVQRRGSSQKPLGSKRVCGKPLNRSYNQGSAYKLQRKRIDRTSTAGKDRKALQFLENEIQILKRLSHHHVVKFVGYVYFQQHPVTFPVY
jgi:serine/threonine protein kinase